MADDSLVEIEFLIICITSNLCEVVTSGIKEHGVHEVLCVFYAERLAGAKSCIEFSEAFLIVLGRVLSNCGNDLGIVTENADDIFVAADSERTNKSGHGHLFVSVNMHAGDIIRVCFIFKPCTTVRDNCGCEELLS